MHWRDESKRRTALSILPSAAPPSTGNYGHYGIWTIAEPGASWRGMVLLDVPIATSLPEASIAGRPARRRGARLMLIGSAGVIAVYSHRIYGKAAGPAMSDWLRPGPKVERR
jgi:hypothetical protein